MTSERTGRGGFCSLASLEWLYLRRDWLDMFPCAAGAAGEAVSGVPRQHPECWREMGRENLLGLRDVYTRLCQGGGRDAAERGYKPMALRCVGRERDD
nr:MAG TPA: hypothetical protein [Caudoviricetes sp.]